MVNSLPAWPGLSALVLLTAAGLGFYLPLAWRVFACSEGKVANAWVDKTDVLLAVVLAVWFALLGYDALASAGNSRILEFRHLLGGAATYAAVVILLVGTLIFRNCSLISVFARERLSFLRALWRALLLLLAAYPVLMLVQAAAYGVGGKDAPPQDIVQFLQNAGSLRDRGAVLLMAVLVAPVAEEIIFRGYLYPVGKKYLGSAVSAVMAGVLFAALHGHAASFPALFVLALVLTLSYEKSGNLLVPVLMHAVFNAVSIAGILLFL